ncbi:protocadherin-11 X-linked [Striga asiatica]|uniref:Protocadherin-11 X-linked n=1 Tax=Striga asiatica TaxID=4170 RepID=A0A5A7R8X0_STRAF|nr:protocadherin-11 X-linked [Striga asiatica]
MLLPFRLLRHGRRQPCVMQMHRVLKLIKGNQRKILGWAPQPSQPIIISHLYIFSRSAISLSSPPTISISLLHRSLFLAGVKIPHTPPTLMTHAQEIRGVFLLWSAADGTEATRRWTAVDDGVAAR